MDVGTWSTSLTKDAAFCRRSCCGSPRLFLTVLSSAELFVLCLQISGRSVPVIVHPIRDLVPYFICNVQSVAQGVHAGIVLFPAIPSFRERLHASVQSPRRAAPDTMGAFFIYRSPSSRSLAARHGSPVNVHVHKRLYNLCEQLAPV